MPWRQILSHDFLSHIAPFVLAAGAKQPQWNIQRILESLIIAAITAGVTMYGVVQSMRVEISQLHTDIQRVETQARENYAQHSIREDRIENKIDNHLIRK